MRKFIFYLILAIAAFGLMMNLDEFLFSIMKAIISFAIIALIIYIIYYFFFLTEDQRKYKKALRKYKRQKKAIRRYQMISPYCFLHNYLRYIHASERYFSSSSCTSSFCFSVNSRGLKSIFSPFLKPDLKAFSISFNVIC